MLCYVIHLSNRKELRLLVITNSNRHNITTTTTTTTSTTTTTTTTTTILLLQIRIRNSSSMYLCINQLIESHFRLEEEPILPLPTVYGNVSHSRKRRR